LKTQETHCDTKVTDRDREWVDILLTLWRRHLRPPTRQELANAAGTTRDTAVDALYRLKSRGLVKFEEKKSRTIRPVGFKCTFNDKGVYLLWESPKAKGRK